MKSEWEFRSYRNLEMRPQLPMYQIISQWTVRSIDISCFLDVLDRFFIRKLSQIKRTKQRLNFSSNKKYINDERPDFGETDIRRLRKNCAIDLRISLSLINAPDSLLCSRSKTEMVPIKADEESII